METPSAGRASAGVAPSAGSATRITVSTFGAMAGLAGIEHGIGEILQGGAAPEGVMILSWPDSGFFRILGGEPAMTVVPDLLVTGVLAVAVSLAFLVWAVGFVERRHGGAVLLLLSAVMLLVGAGFGPPGLGVILGLAAIRMNAPPGSRRSRQPGGLLLARLWPWSYGAALISWLTLMPGMYLLDRFFGLGGTDLAVPLLSFTTLSAFGTLLLAIFAGLARDAAYPTGPRRTTLEGG